MKEDCKALDDFMCELQVDVAMGKGKLSVVVRIVQ